MIVRTPVADAPGTKRSGLSLLEVILALAIFLMSLVALGQLISLGGDMARDVQWISRAMMLAESRMAELSAGSLPLTSQSETPCDDDPDFSWSVDAEADSLPGLFRVTVTVSRQRTDGSKFESKLNQMVLDPTARGNTDGTATGTDTTTATTTTGSTTGGGS
jgi:type II secretory pathway pseudopilin PulG